MKEEIKEVEEKLAERKETTGKWRRVLLKFCTPVLLEAYILTFVAGHTSHSIDVTFLQNGEIEAKSRPSPWLHIWTPLACRSGPLWDTPSAQGWL